jgi:demethylmenaquinone methyltransferase/2-methoxy-6-polyprenyl-1,4-benzoquinol methylase
MARMIDSLEIPPGGTGLDAGCGIGSQMPLLARAAGRGCRGGSGRGGDGYIVGVDYDIDSLLHARSRPTQKNASYLRGNLTRLPFSDDTFDWAVSVDCVGMMPESAESMISELVRIIKPGGMLALASWTSQQLLPGHPLLETRLNATAQGVAPFRDGLSPSLHFLRLGERLEAAGLGDIRVRSFLGDIHPPRDTREERALSSLFYMRWGNDPSDLPEKERSLYRSLIDPPRTGASIADPITTAGSSTRCSQAGSARPTGSAAKIVVD